MKIIHVELLSQSMLPDRTCTGSVCVHGTAGERVQIQYSISLSKGLSRRHANAAIARDAIRQIKRMPEHRTGKLIIEEHALPQKPPQRVIRL
ncbi:MAG: hypothetical protein JXQ85_03405 [Cognatishimia sp.]|uniref:hypothetical protein n=1 Tax=Cognatishimia sp. TaxID=2211648 RepID=UPI003B8B3E50